MTAPVLEAVGLVKEFSVRSRLGGHSTVRPIDDVDFRLLPGRATALVGESGSGKTTLARMLARFYDPTAGELRLDGRPMAAGRRAERAYRSAVQMVFQDPFGSLNPVHRVRHTIERAVRLHHPGLDRAERRRRTLEALERVSLLPAADYVDKFPHELSGGQRQRVVIARALAVQPRVLLGDEPISMLDVSIRLEILNLLDRLRRDDGLALLYITHDIASARYLCDEIAVMYAGRIVEHGPTEQVIAAPRHPYTQLLIDSSPDPHRDAELGRDALFDAGRDLGEPPSLADPPPGCRFHPRCPLVRERCRTDAPASREVDGRRVECWYAEDTRGGAATTLAAAGPGDPGSRNDATDATDPGEPAS